MPIPLGILAVAGAGAGGAGSYELIETTVLGSTATSVTFSSIPQTYKHLQIRVAAKAASGGTDLIITEFNSVTGASYASHALRGTGSSVVAYAINDQSGGSFAGRFSADGNFGASIIDILDYASTNKNTTVRALTGVASTSSFIELWSGLFNNTNAVTQIKLLTNSGSGYTSGSRFSLYGVK